MEKQIRIGVGVTSFNRPECLKECLDHIYKHTFMDNVTLYVATDTDEDRQGVAKRKNECLRALKDCDYVFLFDEDCFPIKDGWIEYFVKKLNIHKVNHLLFLNQSHNKESVGEKLIDWYRDCGGVFMALTKECIEKVGAFNEKFGIYGFEHAEYSQRIYRAGLNRFPYMCAPETYKYIYAYDYDKSQKHKSSITDEEKRIHVKNNWDKFFKEEIKSVYLPL